MMIDFDDNLVSYKLDSAITKLNVLIDNISLFLDNPSWWTFGSPIRPPLSENSAVDLIYYFGISGGVVILILIVGFGLFGRYFKYDQTFLSGISSERLFFLIVFLLNFMQNSVWLPPISFLLGYMLMGNSFTVKRLADAESITVKMV